VIEGLSVLALITARGGSKGLPGKNILLVHGRPLIAWTIDAAKGSKYVDRLVLSSDDPQIIAAARILECESPFVRNAALASDAATSIEVVLDALARLPRHDLLVLLQPTSPLRTAADIDAALELLVRTDAPACVSVRPALDHPLWTFALTADGRLKRFGDSQEPTPPRRQDLQPAWCLNGAVYAARVSWLEMHKTFLTEHTVGIEMPLDRSIDIDTLDDFEAFTRSVASRTNSQGG
jgi:N-acylneuraminate cytidylyltransferase